MMGWRGISRYVDNYGVSFTTSLLTHCGQANDLAHHVLILRLLPLLKKTAQTAPPTSVRIVMQSSEMHRLAPGDTKFLSKAEINHEGPDGAQL